MTDDTAQRQIWNEEHANPAVLLQMDSSKPSSGVVRFYDYLRSHGLPHGEGIEMGCGKGRSAIWLAQQGVTMKAFDFSEHAILEARRRAQEAGVAASVTFFVGDATQTWPYESNTFDFGVDCFASTDIVSPEGRRGAIKEMHRVLKPGGYALAYLLSTEDEFHRDMIKHSAAPERNAFLHTTGKFEKTYDDADIQEIYGTFKIMEHKRIEKTAEFFGKSYQCRHHWLVLRKVL